MPVVKKTVAIEPIIDNYIRKMWAILIERGYDSSYSTALNYMLLGQILCFSELEIPKDVRDSLSGFLHDEDTLQDLNLEDYGNIIDEIFKKKESKR